MESWKDFYNRSKLGKSRFKSDSPFMMGILKVREIAWTIDAISAIALIVCMIVLKYSMLKAWLISIVVHMTITGILATIGTIQEREWRRKNNIKKQFRATLDRLALNESRTVKDEDKTRFGY